MTTITLLGRLIWPVASSMLLPPASHPFPAMARLCFVLVFGGFFLTAGMLICAFAIRGESPPRKAEDIFTLCVRLAGSVMACVVVSMVASIPGTILGYAITRVVGQAGGIKPQLVTGIACAAEIASVYVFWRYIAPRVI